MNPEENFLRIRSSLSTVWFTFAGLSHAEIRLLGSRSFGDWLILNEIIFHHRFQANADALDVITSAGLGYQMNSRAAVKIEYTAQELEEISKPGVDAGVSQMATSSVDWRPKSTPMSLKMGPGVLLRNHLIYLVGRLSLIFPF